MVRELATGLVARGFQVTVATGLPHHPTGKVPESYRRLWQAEESNRLRVVRLWHPTSERRRIDTRAVVMASQTFATAVASACMGRHDVVLSFGGPPLIGPVASGLLAVAWGVPLVTVLHDLYPDVAVESGHLSNPLLIKAARQVEQIQYRLSNHFVVLGETTRDALVRSRALDVGRFTVIPVWLDPNEIRPSPRDNAWRHSQGLALDRFVVLYSGTCGIISGAEVLADVARLVDPDVHILVVGGGSAWQALDERRRQGGLPANLRLLPYQARADLPLVQASSDLSLLTLLPGRGRTSVPSKLQGYMAAGRPVLAAVDEDCDSARLLRRGEFGLVVAPARARAIADGIAEARRDPDRLARWGRAARDVFERENARDPIVDRYAELLRELLRAAPRS